MSGGAAGGPDKRHGLSRRALLAGSALAPLAACRPHAETASEANFSGGWVGASFERGHRLRQLSNDSKSGVLPTPAVQRSAGVLVIGAGIAGLACARALTRCGIDEVHLFDLEDAPGGNSRSQRLGGMACPLGAHYLPLPNEQAAAQAAEVIELLQAFGLRRTEHGRAVYDERHLCHSPQERVCIAGHWHDGLLPPAAALPAAERAPTQAQYRRFAARVAALATPGAFTMPTARSRWNAELAALDRVSFAQWLNAERFDAPALRWYLDYCCRDDYGAGAAFVSAWAGIHYFASRHGFHAPGDDTAERDGVLTWPEGNAWLAGRLAAPLAERLHTGTTALRVAEGRHAVEVDLWNEVAQRSERWRAPQVVLATPLFVSARLLGAPPPALVAAAAQLHYAPWLVANLLLSEALADRPGAPPSWDNVFYDPSPGAEGQTRAAPALGYVDAMHQSLRPYADATVLTAYVALGGDDPGQLHANRAALLADGWRPRAEAVLRDLARVHADLPRKVTRIDLMRYGHAMAIPLPGVRSSAALAALPQTGGRVHFAHSDLSGYSVFEEALFHGHAAGVAAGAAAGKAAAA